ncbi:MAG TPA: hypothetical protein VKR58_03300 [Aquella sp.]|nr:hypothetical protein [Aquella sp.]
MTQLSDLLKPPTPNEDAEQQYLSRSSVYNYLNGISTISNASKTNNADFNTLGPGGLTPTTQTDGDNHEFMSQWFVVGAGVATYTLTPTVYPANSGIISASPYFVHAVISGYLGTGLYFYQRQLNTLRLYQSSYITMTVNATNNGSNTIKMRAAINSFYNPSSNLTLGAAIFLKPGENTVSSTLSLLNIRNQTVGSGSYTEFRLLFDDLGTTHAANIDFHAIKAEFGTISTPLY